MPPDPIKTAAAAPPSGAAAAVFLCAYITNLDFGVPQRGQRQLSGSFENLVPGFIPLPGSPLFSS